MKYFIINEQNRAELLAYLQKLPYEQVAGFINGLGNLQEATIVDAPEKKEETKDGK